VLALGLHDALAAAGRARIVSLSSVGHLRSPVVFDDLDFTSRPYDPGVAYGQSKTANVLFAVEASRRWAAEGIYANAVHAGGHLPAAGRNRRAVLRRRQPSAGRRPRGGLRRGRGRGRLPLDPDSAARLWDVLLAALGR
jgi:NAD(P)-dependent dehydrogenase (short-subunit alcohol dehydrogenase family)